MFTDFLRRLTAPFPQRLTVPDSRLALAALMVRVARADGQYAEAEVSRIDQLLTARYGISAQDAAVIRLDAERLETEAPDTVRFTRAIKDAVPYEDRTGVIVALWQVVLADGARDTDEDGLMRLVANLLGVNDRDSALARQQAEGR